MPFCLIEHIILTVKRDLKIKLCGFISVYTYGLCGFISVYNLVFQEAPEICFLGMYVIADCFALIFHWGLFILRKLRILANL